MRTTYRRSWKAVRKISIYVFEKISERMKSAGFERTIEQCRVEIKKLKGEYKKIKDNQSTGQGRKDWKHYDALNEILGSRPSTQLLVIVDTLADDDNEDSAEKSKKDECEDEVVPSESNVTSLESSYKEYDEKDVFKHDDKKEECKKRRKKRQRRDEKIENTMETLMAKILERQNKAIFRV